MKHLFFVFGLALAGCHSDQSLKDGDEAADLPSDPSSDETPTTPSIAVDTASTSDSGTSYGSDTGSSSESAPIVVPCSLEPDAQALSDCSTGSWAAVVGGVGYPTIQKAVDAAGGSLVAICPGAWTESVTLGSGTLQAADPTAGVTTLDAGGADHALVVVGDATLEGFTVTGAELGAIVHEGDSITLQCMSLVDNRAVLATPGGSGGPGGDGGALSTSGELTVLESLFDTNEAGYSGGAIVSGGTAPIAITDSTFVANRSGEEGGALAVYEGVTTLTRVLFDGNRAGYDGGGVTFGGWDDSAMTIVDSTFQNNVSGYEGGALSVGSWATDAVSISGSAFTANTADYEGGAISLGTWGGLATEISGCTFSANTARSSGAISVGGWLQDGGTLTLDAVTFEDNASTASGTGGVYGVAGNAPAIDVVGTGVIAYRNQGGRRGGAVVMDVDDSFECTGCDFGSGVDDNGPNDAVKGSTPYGALGVDFSL